MLSNYPRLKGNKNNYISSNYQLMKLEEIGKGGFGIVYKVYDIITERMYALKILMKKKEDRLQDLLQSAYHEITMALKTMSLKN